MTPISSSLHFLEYETKRDKYVSSVHTDTHVRYICMKGQVEGTLILDEDQTGDWVTTGLEKSLISSRFILDKDIGNKY